MVLRSGIIIPFQFRDSKKLLMIGVPEENRDLSIWDLKNVVRAAFGIYNFEFRNKKIGFNIPDELLLNYLAQRHDLTNFVIEVGQAIDDGEPPPTTKGLHKDSGNESLCYEPTKVPMPHKSKDNSNDAITTKHNHTQLLRDEKPPEEATHNNQTVSTNDEPPQKLRITQVYSQQSSPETLTQSIDPMDIMPKSEQEESELEMRHARYESRIASMQQHHQQQQQQQQQQQYFHNFGHNMLEHAAQQSPGSYNRFRRRGERMSKDQKELYVKYFEENPCMLTQRRNVLMLEPHWHKLCNMLNSVPQGAMKNVEEWKQTFDAWRYRVFMYTRYNSKLIGLAAQNPKNYKPLTSTDQRAYAMWTSHKNTAPHDYERMDMFAQLDESNAEFDY